MAGHKQLMDLTQDSLENNGEMFWSDEEDDSGSTSSKEAQDKRSEHCLEDTASTRSSAGITSGDSRVGSRPSTSLGAEGSIIQSNELSDLSVWEKWIVKKTKELHVKQLEEQQRKIEERSRAAQRKREVVLKQRLAEQQHKVWVRTKVEEERKQREEERRRKEAEEEEKHKREEDIRRRADASFARWKREKARQKKQQVQQQLEAEADKVSKAAKRREQADLAYEKWLQEAETNYRQRGYMYREQPEPSFCNSSNWIGPCDDKSGDIASQSTSAARANSHCINGTPHCQISISDKHMCIKLRSSHNRHYH